MRKVDTSLPPDVVRVVSLLLEDLGTPLALSAEIKIRYGEWEGLLDFTPDPRSYLDAGKYGCDAAAFALLRKLVDFPGKVDTAAAARQKWWEAERACYRTNERLHRYCAENRVFNDAHDAAAPFLETVRKIILDWIGYGPDDLAVGRFGPGATFSDRGGRSTVPDKMSTDPSLTRDAIWYLPQWLGNQWGSSFLQRHGEFSWVPGNRYTTVPKTAKTDRSIAVEPSINVFFQLALGRQLRRRLARRPRTVFVADDDGNITSKTTRFAGWDLDCAQDVHRQVAETSSVTREFATLDLSNASDTVARVLVKALLPHGWFEALDDLRSKKTRIENQWVVLEKFSSMGNGFTFELETIIFGALACATTRECGELGLLGVDVFVFGDDIIVKNSVARPLKSVLEFCGFSLNMEKSYFGDEPFRESCGADFFSGKPVRPYYLKELPRGPQDYICFANGIRHLTDRLAKAGRFVGRRGWFAALDCIPVGIRSCRGPKDLGDLVIYDEGERWTTRHRRQIRYIKVWRPARMRVISYGRFHPDVVLACATYGLGSYRGGVLPRDCVLSYKVGWIPWS